MIMIPPRQSIVLYTVSARRRKQQPRGIKKEAVILSRTRRRILSEVLSKIPREYARNDGFLLPLCLCAFVPSSLVDSNQSPRADPAVTTLFAAAQVAMSRFWIAAAINSG